MNKYHVKIEMSDGFFTVNQTVNADDCFIAVAKVMQFVIHHYPMHGENKINGVEAWKVD